MKLWCNYNAIILQFTLLHVNLQLHDYMLPTIYELNIDYAPIYHDFMLPIIYELNIEYAPCFILVESKGIVLFSIWKSLYITLTAQLLQMQYLANLITYYTKILDKILMIQYINKNSILSFTLRKISKKYFLKLKNFKK